MSKVEVDTLAPATGTTITIGESGDTVALGSGATASGFGGGKIGQVVQATRNTNVTNTSSSLVDGISATITPTSTSSKILLLLSFQWSANATADGIGGRFVRNIPSTDTVIITDANDGGTSYYFAYDAGTSGLYNRVSFSYLDSPSSTSAITYKYQFVPYSGSGSCTFSQTGSGANSTTSFILQEVLA